MQNSSETLTKQTSTGRKILALDSQIDCIQPGGGVCMRIELTWGAWRRFYLRLFRRGYLKRMAKSRRGSENQCQWDVLDPRDLKFHVNQEGYSWSAADDPFTWRDQLPFARAGLAEMIIFSSVLIPLSCLFVILACRHSIGWSVVALLPILLQAEII
ncbi:MAG: hypothetical protein HOF72_00635, partial [Planctomycetaceae bacterium]|nr:hypothetical protein [Planctomycetaceae bacterium]